MNKIFRNRWRNNLNKQLLGPLAMSICALTISMTPMQLISVESSETPCPTVPIIVELAECTTNAVIPVSEPAVVTVESVEVPEPEVEEDILMSRNDIELIALVTMAEAEGECEEGQRLVIDVILNRVDSEKYADTVEGVIYQKGQFSSMWNGRVDKCRVTEELCQLVEEELQSRTNYDVLYFTANHYGKYGTPLFSVGNHYFSGI